MDEAVIYCSLGDLPVDAKEWLIGRNGWTFSLDKHSKIDGIAFEDAVDAITFRLKFPI